jgi:adenylylsulfate kinase-like enzyme
MGRNTTNGNGESATGSKYPIHLVLQGKGGVGKSVVASWLAEFLIQRGGPVRCIDGDPVNPGPATPRTTGACS